MANIEFIIPSVLNKGMGEKKISLQAHDLHEAFAKVSNMLGDDFKRRVFDLNGKPRALINIYINGKNMRLTVMECQHYSKTEIHCIYCQQWPVVRS